MATSNVNNNNNNNNNIPRAASAHQTDARISLPISMESPIISNNGIIELIDSSDGESGDELIFNAENKALLAKKRAAQQQNVCIYPDALQLPPLEPDDEDEVKSNDIIKHRKKIKRPRSKNDASSSEKPIPPKKKRKINTSNSNSNVHQSKETEIEYFKQQTNTLTEAVRKLKQALEKKKSDGFMEKESENVALKQKCKRYENQRNTANEKIKNKLNEKDNVIEKLKTENKQMKELYEYQSKKTNEYRIKLVNLKKNMSKIHDFEDADLSKMKEELKQKNIELESEKFANQDKIKKIRDMREQINHLKKELKKQKRINRENIERLEARDDNIYEMKLRYKNKINELQHKLRKLEIGACNDQSQSHFVERSGDDEDEQHNDEDEDEESVKAIKGRKRRKIVESSSDEDEDEMEGNNEEDDPEYEVKAFHGRIKKMNGDVMYLTEWFGYKFSDCTWEPASGVMECTEVMNTFGKQLKTNKNTICKKHKKEGIKSIVPCWNEDCNCNNNGIRDLRGDGIKYVPPQ